MTNPAEVKGHTPTPWVAFNKLGVLAIMRGTKEVIHWAGFDSSQFPKQNVANAKLIVEAVNSHARLLREREGLIRALRESKEHMVGLKAYLATCATDIIIENLEATIGALRKQ